MLQATTNALRYFSIKSTRSTLSSNKLFRFLSTTKNNPPLLVLNAVGTDRTGIVSEVTKHVLDYGGNVGESQATKLGNYFSLLMLIQNIPPKELTNFKNSISNIENLNSSIFETNDDTNDETAAEKKNAAIAYSGTVQLEGADRPGIVHTITSLLASYGLSIETLKTNEGIIAPHGGTTLFEMKCTAVAYKPLAKGFDSTIVQSKLDDLGDSLNCDITLVDNSDK